MLLNDRQRIQISLGFAQAVPQILQSGAQLSAEHVSFLSRLADPGDLNGWVHHPIVMLLNPLPAAGHTALNAPLTPGALPPFIAWLLTPEGIKWAYGVAQFIASLFGITLPPLPPIPTPHAGQ